MSKTELDALLRDLAAETSASGRLRRLGRSWPLLQSLDPADRRRVVAVLDEAWADQWLEKLLDDEARLSPWARGLRSVFERLATAEPREMRRLAALIRRGRRFGISGAWSQLLVEVLEQEAEAREKAAEETAEASDETNEAAEEPEGPAPGPTAGTGLYAEVDTSRPWRLGARGASARPTTGLRGEVEPRALFADREPERLPAAASAAAAATGAAAAAAIASASDLLTAEEAREQQTARRRAPGVHAAAEETRSETAGSGEPRPGAVYDEDSESGSPAAAARARSESGQPPAGSEEPNTGPPDVEPRPKIARPDGSGLVEGSHAASAHDASVRHPLAADVAASDAPDEAASAPVQHEPAPSARDVVSEFLRPEARAAGATRPGEDEELEPEGARASGAVERLRLLRRLESDPGFARRLGADERRRLVAGLAPGWAGRRALQRLIRAGAYGSLDEALELVGLLPSPAQRTWCLLELAERTPDLDRLLAAAPSPAARRRIERRARRG